MIVMYSIPKTGTSTVEYSARISTHLRTVVLNRENYTESFDAICNHPTDYDFISGHRISSIIVNEIRRKERNVTTLTLWREPSYQILSAYHYDLAYKYRFYIPFPIWYYGLIPRNPQASHLCRRYENNFVRSLVLSSEHITYIKNILATFDHVITTEHIDTLVPELFDRHYGLEQPFQLVRRKTTGTDYRRRIAMTPNLRYRLNRQNRVDYEIHRELVTRVTLS